MSREEAERRRGFDPDVPPADRAKNRSLFFDDLLDAKVREFLAEVRGLKYKNVAATTAVRADLLGVARFQVTPLMTPWSRISLLERQL